VTTEGLPSRPSTFSSLLGAHCQVFDLRLLPLRAGSDVFWHSSREAHKYIKVTSDGGILVLAFRHAPSLQFLWLSDIPPSKKVL